MKEEYRYSRRIQKTGGSTFTVALPVEWIRQAKLDKGETVTIFTQPDGNLLIQPTSNKYKLLAGETEIDIGKIDDTNLILRLILSKYLYGYNIIKIYDKNDIDLEIRAEITSFVSTLMGVEVVEESTNWIVLKDLSSLESLDLDQLIKRMHVLADKMFNSSIEAFIKNQKDTARLIRIQESSVDKLYFLVSRQLNAVLTDFSYCSYLGLKLVEVLDYKLIVKRLEAIADHAFSIAQMTIDAEETINDTELINKISILRDKVRERYNSAIQYFYSRNIVAANEIANEKSVIYEQIHALYNSVTHLKSEDAIKMILVLKSFERISSYSADIAELVINRER